MKKEPADKSTLIFDRNCALSWKCTPEHAREVRLYFTGGSQSAWTSERDCRPECRCPKAVLVAGGAR